MDLAPDLFRTVDLLGVLCNGILGGLIARERRFDLVGFAVLAVLSALAGGMVRDVLLQAGPPVAIVDPFYLATALVGAVVAFTVSMAHRVSRVALMVIEALSLGTWAATGTVKALGLGHWWLAALMLGVITATGGGMIRDVAIGQVPAIFTDRSPLLATAAVLAGTAALLTPPELRSSLGMGLATLVGGALVLLSRWRRWRLPAASDEVVLTRAQLGSLVRRVQAETSRRHRRAERRRTADEATGE